MFVLILGLLMALLSFGIDYLIEKVNEGTESLERHSVICFILQITTKLECLFC